MPATLTLIASTPIRSQFALDQLNLTYKSDLPWDQTVIDPSVPEKGDAHPTFTFMFVAEVRLQESSASACEFDVLYIGAFASSGGNPILPASKTDQDIAVLSSSSSKAGDGTVLTTPATVQYYAPTSVKTYFTYNAAATGNFAPNPTANIVPISLTIADTGYSITEPIANVVNKFFTQQIIHTIESSELVLGGKYWQNVSRKQKLLQPWLFAVTPGAYISLYNPGTGYTAGNVLTITAAGQSATISVVTVGSIWGDGAGILSFTVTANTFTASHNALPATGGSGSDAGFNVWYIS
jgi:hypothetical protein